MNGLFALFTALTCLANGTSPNLDVAKHAPASQHAVHHAVRAHHVDRHSIAHRHSPGRRHHSHGAVRHQHRLK